jgi:signal transduction histidine kinase
VLPLSQDGLIQLNQQKDVWSIEEVDGKRLLIYHHPVVSKNQVIFIVQVARSLAERDQSLQILGRTLIIATLTAFLVTFGISWLLAKEALRPIRRITETAREIGSRRDFTRRLADPRLRDEVGELALTFNAMLVQLESAYQKVAHALDAQHSFVADVSHELRTPLTTLRGNLGLLHRQSVLSAAEQADILNDMEEESDRLIRLVNDLLMLARADAGRKLAKEPVALDPLIEGITRQLRQLDPRQRIRVAVPADVWINGDRDALKQVLLIVLDNALKHTAGAIQLAARAEKDVVHLRVTDQGPGMAPEQLARVFDRFYRGESQGSPPGLGLGLPIARKLVENLDGRLTIESDPQRGSVIEIQLEQALPERGKGRSPEC